MVLTWLIIFSSGLLGSFLEGQSLYEKHIKRTDKTLNKVYEGQHVNVLALTFEQKTLEKDFIIPELYTVTNNKEEFQAYMCLNEAPSKVDTFTYLVLYDSMLNVLFVEVLEYKENYGGEISSKRFLKQFQGSNGTKELELEKDLDGISGATISVKSILWSINDLNENMIKMRAMGII
jgi:Na+-translocating ferredoxin:NAD+ oxidoreductase RnfG subunit